jgi:hypothetical protein
LVGLFVGQLAAVTDLCDEEGNFVSCFHKVQMG